MRSRPARLALPAVVTAALLASCAAAQKRLPPAEPLRYGGWSATFPTGMRVVAIELAGARRATVCASYAAGPVTEPPGKEGLSELAARLTARARGARGGYSLQERQFASGAVAELTVRADDLEFRTLARADRVDEALAIEADRLRGPLEGVTEGDFLSERETLAAQLEADAEAPDDEASQLAALTRRALRGTPFDRAPPTAASVRALALEDVRRWLALHLRPDRAVLVVTTPEPARALVERAAGIFGVSGPGPGGAPVPPVALPALPDGALRPDAGPPDVQRVAGATPRLWLGWPVPGDASGAPASAAGAAALLEWRLGAATARLGDRVTRLEVGVRRANGASLLYAVFDLANEADAEVVHRDALRALGRGGPFDPWAVALVRAGFRDVGVLAAEAGHVPDAAPLIRATGQPDPLAARRAQADLLAIDALDAYYRRWVRADRAASVAFAPTAAAVESAEPVPDPEVGGWTLGVDLLSAAAPGRDDVERLLADAGLGAATPLTLSNGLRVVVVPRGELPVVEARLVIHPDVVDRPGAAVLGWLAPDLSRKPWSVTGSLECPWVRRGPAGEGLVFHEAAAAAHLPAVLEKLSCWTNRSFDAGALERLRTEDAALRRLRRRGEVRAASALTAEVYGEAHRVPPTRETLAELDVADALAWLRAQYSPAHALLVLSGKVTASPALLADLERTLGRWPAGPPRAAPTRRPEPRARRVIIVDAPGAKHALAKVAVRLPPRAEADSTAEAVLAQVLELRLARAALPRGSAGAGLAGFADDPFLLGELRLPVEGAAQGVAGALATLATLAGSGVDDLDANLARWLVAREEAYAADTLRGATLAAETLFLQGRALAARDRLALELAAVDGARVGRAAAAAGIGREIVVVVGDAARLDPALRAVGLAPVVVRQP